jgi:arabinofuranosyltransferase
MRRPYILGAAVFVASLAIFLALAHAYGCTRIGGVRHWVLHDDFMISERYARNLAQGRGLVFNPGERVEGFSDPLMVLAVCLPLEWMHVEARKLGLFVWIVNGICSSLIVLGLVFGFSGARLRVAALATALVYLTLPHHGFFARAGMEVYLQALCLMIVVARLHAGGLAFYAALAALPLVHAMDLPLWLGALLLRLRGQRHRGRPEAQALALASLPLFGYFVFRLAYYHQIFPNTYYAKAASVLALGRGVEYLLHGASWIAPLLIVGAIAFWKMRATPRSALPVLGVVFFPFLVYVAKLGGDNFEWYRFVFILIPALLALTGEAAGSLEGSSWAAFCLAAAGLQIVVNIWGYRHADGNNRWLLAWDKSRIALGYAIEENTAPDQTVALFGIGNAAYFGERAVIDMLGKTDLHIARTRPKKQRWVGHQKDDPDYVMGRRPDFVEMSYSPREMQDVEQLQQERHGRWGYFADLALDPTFRRDYSPVTSNLGAIPVYARNDVLARRWVVLPELMDR